MEISFDCEETINRMQIQDEKQAQGCEIRRNRKVSKRLKRE